MFRSNLQTLNYVGWSLGLEFGPWVHCWVRHVGSWVPPLLNLMCLKLNGMEANHKRVASLVRQSMRNSSNAGYIAVIVAELMDLILVAKGYPRPTKDK